MSTLHDITNNILDAYDYASKAYKTAILGKDYIFDSLSKLGKMFTLLIDAELTGKRPKKITWLCLLDSLRLLKIAKANEVDETTIENLDDAIYELNEAWDIAQRD
jgi:hypothetical protein